MRRSFTLTFAFALAFASCSAIDDFNQFKFQSPNGAMFGDACPTMSCMQYNALRPVGCVTNFPGNGGVDAPGGICTHPCTVGAANACNDLAGADCVAIQGQGFCLAHCTVSAASQSPCRQNWSCCAGGHTVTDGVCAPTDSDVCH
jgi:hypothetical protein